MVAEYITELTSKGYRLKFDQQPGFDGTVVRVMKDGFQECYLIGGYEFNQTVGDDQDAKMKSMLQFIVEKLDEGIAKSLEQKGEEK